MSLGLAELGTVVALLLAATTLIAHFRSRGRSEVEPYAALNSKIDHQETKIASGQAEVLGELRLINERLKTHRAETSREIAVAVSELERSSRDRLEDHDGRIRDLEAKVHHQQRGA